MESRPRVIDQTAALLDDVDRALDRLAEGTYRLCEVCGAEIEELALEADATTRLCLLHRPSA